MGDGCVQWSWVRSSVYTFIFVKMPVTSTLHRRCQRCFSLLRIFHNAAMACGCLIPWQSPSIAIYTTLTCRLCKIRACSHTPVWDKSETELDFSHFLPSWWILLEPVKQRVNLRQYWIYFGFCHVCKLIEQNSLNSIKDCTLEDRLFETWSNRSQHGVNVLGCVLAPLCRLTCTLTFRWPEMGVWVCAWDWYAVRTAHLQE